ncbi:U3 small nucleolar ribonucleoprotein [Perilla frutescens var. hirtella]|uniref:U3 small nucleolar ribonucleoprotein n=1 Tax=Perilla frutescens var. hirtella TaxID=608512 RepID=A0AAD4JGR2_PERFH|nr:U3 small nucleolar ribonucleoprotein [Perilla frutescens var. hirtella]
MAPNDKIFKKELQLGNIRLAPCITALRYASAIMEGTWSLHLATGAAPLTVSDAAMLAPEEVFSGEKDIKEETKLTKADRKRRPKKKKFKAQSVRRMALKAQLSTLKKPDSGNLILSNPFHAALMKVSISISLDP